jgi:hypothetical protein
MKVSNDIINKVKVNKWSMTLAQNHQQQLNGISVNFLFLLKIIFNNRYSNGTIFSLKFGAVLLSLNHYTLTLMKYFFAIYIPFSSLPQLFFTGKAVTHK